MYPMKNGLICSLALLLLAAGSAQADPLEGPLDKILNQGLRASGEAYLALGQEVRDLGPEATQALAERAQNARFTTASWRQDLNVLMLDAWVNHREEATRTQDLVGLDPHVYLSQRRPVPSVDLELRSMKLPAGALYLAYYKTASLYPYAGRDQYPTSITDPVHGALRRGEQDALKYGLLIAIGASGHPGAARVLAEVALNSAEDDVTRGVAAAHLGNTESAAVAFPVLQQLAASKGSDRLRTSAISGMARLRQPEVLVELRRYARPNQPLAVRQAAVVGLGNLGSAWLAETDRRPESEALRGQAATALVDLLLGPGGADVEVQTLEALTRTADPGSRKRLQEAVASADDEGARNRARRGVARVELALSRQR